MLYKRGRKDFLKNDNQYTINVNDNLATMIEKLAAYYQRKPAEYLRRILLQLLSDEYAKIMIMDHPENKESMTEAIFHG